MKLATAIVCAIALTAGAATASAEADTVSSKTTKTCEKCAKAKMQVRTGSYLPRKVDGNGRIDNGPSQLVVITSEDIRRGGYSTVFGTLSGQGLRR